MQRPCTACDHVRVRRRTRQILLIAIAGLCALMLLLFLANPGVGKHQQPPADLRGKAAWLAAHPADWETASDIAELALDSTVPRRAELWRASYALARHVAPRRLNPDVAFVRGGLFHWYELSGGDRKTVLDAAAPLLRNPQIFNDLYLPLWELTRDFGYLLRNSPSDLGTLEALRNIAASNGRFDDYRQVRAVMQRRRLAAFEEQRAKIAPHELVQLLSNRVDADDDALVRRILQELHDRSFDPSLFRAPAAEMIEYAIRHKLTPLDGLTPFVEAADVIPDVTRARLAIALNNPEAATLSELGNHGAALPEWVPYHLERALFEARRGDAAEADKQLRRALVTGRDPAVFAVAEQTAAMLHNNAAAAQFRGQLAALAKQSRTWRGTCGANELCSSAETLVYARGNSIQLKTDVVQADQIAPYIEIYLDDARVAEGEVRNERAFTLPVAPGVHELEVRLVNPRTSSGIQRRVRLS
jgi:hypothetical protein